MRQSGILFRVELPPVTGVRQEVVAHRTWTVIVRQDFDRRVISIRDPVQTFLGEERVQFSAEQGGDNLTNLVVSPALEGVTGRYFDQKKEKEPSKLALAPALAVRLWEASAKLTGV